jgi:hypothetical protein
MLHGLLLGLIAVLGAATQVEQPASIQTVAALEIPLETQADRADLLAMLRRQAAAGGLHVDDGSREREEIQRADPNFPDFARGSLFVGVWRGDNDDDLEVSVDDAGHPNRAWLTFARGSQVEAATRFRETLIRALRQRWPNFRALPILPGGGLPLADDLIHTPSGYRIKRAEAARYDLPMDSPLVAPR